LYAQLLIAASFAIASYQDVRDRAVSDLAWIPAIVGVAYSVYLLSGKSFPSGIEFYVIKVALIGGIALVITFLGYIGQADGIAVAFVAADPYIESPVVPLIFTAAVALAHIGYVYMNGKGRGVRTISMAQFLKEQAWIPIATLSGGTRTEVSQDVNEARDEVEAADKADAMVEVRYGVPTVAYLGVGYLAYVAFLIIFSYPTFLSLP
jgi:hypothetical protein